MSARSITLPLILWLLTSQLGCDGAGSADNSVQTQFLPQQPRASDDPTTSIAEPADKIWGWESTADFDSDIAIFESVFWRPEDTSSLRALIRDTPLAEEKTILEIGTGSGLISLCCLKAGARRVVATDVNSSAVANALYNARAMGFSDRIDVRLVPLNDAGAYSVIAPSERFDLIISNPPWENSGHKPRQISDYALFDPNFELLNSILNGLEAHLKPGGKALLAYGCVTAIRSLEETAMQKGWKFRVLDDRDLDRLPELFLPGMLLEVTP